MKLEDISNYIETMKTAIYGRDMREAIYQSFTQLNTLPDDISSVRSKVYSQPKDICTFMLSTIFGGLKSETNIPILNNAKGTSLSINDFDPTKGDKLVLWENTVEPIVEGTDYTVTKDEENNAYIVKAYSKDVMINVHIQIWNIPTNTGCGVTAPAYPNISTLTTNSISGLIEESD